MGTTLQSSVTDLTPDIGSSDKPLPEPASSQPKPASRQCLDTKGCHERSGRRMTVADAHGSKAWRSKSPAV